MTEPRLVVAFSVDDVAQLTECLGEVWVDRLAIDDPVERHAAVAELCDAIRELTGGRHHSRVDGRGCTCGWNGQELLRHFAAAHRNRDTPDAAVFPVTIDQFDWSRPPGRLIKTWGDAGGLTDEDIATACNLPVDVYRGIVAGSEYITTDIAHKLEAGTQTFVANVWLMLERNYRHALVERAQQTHR